MYIDHIAKSALREYVGIFYNWISVSRYTKNKNIFFTLLT